jgi:hypothetical protein
MALRLLTGIDVPTEPFMPETDAPLTPFEEKYTASGHALWRCRVTLPDSSRTAGAL